MTEVNSVPAAAKTRMGARTTEGWRIYPRIIMAAVSLWRYSGGRVLGGWGPLLCVLLGSLVALLMPLLGVENQYCAALRGMAQLRCQLWDGSPQASSVQSTSLTVPFTSLDVLPQRAKPSKGTDYGINTALAAYPGAPSFFLTLNVSSLRIHPPKSKNNRRVVLQRWSWRPKQRSSRLWR